MQVCNCGLPFFEYLDIPHRKALPFHLKYSTLKASPVPLPQWVVFREALATAAQQLVALLSRLFRSATAAEGFYGSLDAAELSLALTYLRSSGIMCGFAMRAGLPFPLNLCEIDKIVSSPQTAYGRASMRFSDVFIETVVSRGDMSAAAPVHPALRSRSSACMATAAAAATATGDDEGGEGSSFPSPVRVLAHAFRSGLITIFPEVLLPPLLILLQ
jgi:hypothetical protein